MSLIIRPPNFTRLTTNWVDAPGIVTPGVGVTAGANDTVGSTVELLSALAHEVEYLEIIASGYFVSAANSHTLLNILIDPAGGTSYTETLIPNLMVGKTTTLTNEAGPGQYYHFPLFIPRGASIAANAQTARASDITTGWVVINAWGGNSNPGSWWSGRRVTAIGIDTTTSQGTDFATGTSWSSWSDIGSPIPAPCSALQFAAGMRHNSGTDLVQACQYEFGIGGVRVGPRVKRHGTTTERGFQVATGPIFYSAPAGTQFQVRTISDVAVSPQSLAMYAVH